MGLAGDDRCVGKTLAEDVEHALAAAHTGEPVMANRHVRIGPGFRKCRHGVRGEVLGSGFWVYRVLCCLVIDKGVAS